MKLTGAFAHIFFDSFDPSKVIEGDGTKTTEAGKWYRIYGKGDLSDLPFTEKYFFRAPVTGAQIVLVPGDMIYPLELDRICKTTADLSAEQGTVEVGDDCEPGATILDGIVKMSGSIGALFRFNDVTGEYDNVTEQITSRFFEKAVDSGAAGYTLTQRTDDEIFMLINQNTKAKAGQTETWILLPIIISSMSLSLGNTDAQNKDMSWSQGEGPAVIYKAPKAA